MKKLAIKPQQGAKRMDHTKSPGNQMAAHHAGSSHNGSTQTPQSSRFDYVAYDDLATKNQAAFKSMATELETHINASIQCPRSKALALTNLEETYMWIGKGIRNDQIARNGSAQLQESRGNS